MNWIVFDDLSRRTAFNKESSDKSLRIGKNPGLCQCGHALVFY